jgi:hypothetical protein
VTRTRAGGAMLALAVLLALSLTWISATAQSTLPVRAHLAMLASDGTATPFDDLPPPDPSYCPGATSGGASPPNAVLGTVSIGAAPAPVGTLIQITFDGTIGPAARVREPGGYRVLYAAGGGSCSNKVGAAMGIRVNGRDVPTGVSVGDPAANPFLRFDLSLE